MKKLLCLILALVLTASLCGCMRPQREILRVAMSPDFAPMEFIDSTKTGQDQFVGFDVSLAKYLAKGMNMDLEIVPLSFDGCMDALENGEVDLAISGFSWLPQREDRFSLTKTYHAGDNSACQLLIAPEAQAHSYASAEDFSGLRVGAQASSLQEWLVTEQLPDTVLVPFADLISGLELLQSGKIDAMAVADGNASTILASTSGFAKTPFLFELRPELTDNLILVQKGNEQLTEAVNALLTKAEEAGYYPRWYAEALSLAGVGVEQSYDDEGNPE